MNVNNILWLSIIIALLKVLTLYFVLIYIKHLKDNDERLANQSKFAAVICFALSFLIPIIVGILGSH